MRAALFALVALGTFSAIGAATAGTDPGPFSFHRPSGYAFCMRTMYGDDDCSYSTYQQCFVTSSGLGTYCFANPALAYGGTEQPPAPRRRHRHRHHHAS